MAASRTLLSDADLQLYLAGALPWRHRRLLDGLRLCHRDTRRRLEELEAANRAYRDGPQAALWDRITSVTGDHASPAGSDEAFSSASSASAGTFRRPPSPDRAFRSRSAWWKGFSVAALAALALMPVFLARTPPPPTPSRFALEADYTAKGKALGMRAFVKSGARLSAVEGQKALLGPGDTLQIVPLGSSRQYLRLLAWTEDSGWTPVFPAPGQPPQAVSSEAPPPGLVLEDQTEARLASIASATPLTADEAAALLAEPPYARPDTAPPSRLAEGRAIQLFTVRLSGAGPTDPKPPAP